jgi:hypothetical protein
MINLIPFLSLGLNVIVLIVSACCFVKIMGNDLKHVQKDLTEIKNKVNDMDKRLDGVAEKVATIEGRLK